jgi:hypothetical protein
VKSASRFLAASKRCCQRSRPAAISSGVTRHSSVRVVGLCPAGAGRRAAWCGGQATCAGADARLPLWSSAAPAARASSSATGHPVCPPAAARSTATRQVGVGVVVVQDGRLLLLRRCVQPGKGLWALPAGYVDAGEDPREGSSRETLEENGAAGASSRSWTSTRAPDPAATRGVLLPRLRGRGLGGELAAATTRWTPASSAGRAAGAGLREHPRRGRRACSVAPLSSPERAPGPSARRRRRRPVLACAAHGSGARSVSRPAPPTTPLRAAAAGG